MAMDRHRRLERTLFCLVLSMTAGALVLHWGQPARSDAGRPNISLIGSLGWNSIQIIPEVKAFEAAADETHFFVDREGRCLPTARWQDQTPVGQSGVVRIGLQASEQSRTVSPRQWNATTHLVRDLQRQYGVPGEHVILDNSLVLPAQPSPSSPNTRPHLIKSTLQP
jgi:hypothetical protein